MSPDAAARASGPLLGGRQGSGSRPALVIVDLNYAFTDATSPLHCNADKAVQANAQLLAAARVADRPVVFTTVQYDRAGREVARAFLAKVPALVLLAPGTRWPRIDERIAPRETEPVLTKLFASAFFGTPLSALLASHGCDTVVVTGASTSGCVRATAVDALQYGYRVVVPREAVADRDANAHVASLSDIESKYGDVVSLTEAETILAGPRPHDHER
ncbi:MAG: isochorismatase family protein [Solirubrobacteraceae bacterium]